MICLRLREVGVVSSAFPLAYCFSFLATDALIDKGSTRDVLLGGLALADVAVAAMSVVPALPVPLATLWPCAESYRELAQTVRPNLSRHGTRHRSAVGVKCGCVLPGYGVSVVLERWALWATSANVDAFDAPLAVASIATVRFARDTQKDLNKVMRMSD